MALEQGREVFAVPGSPLDPRARGSNDLIRQGATLTEEADDVLRVLDPTLARPGTRAPAPPPTPAPAVDSALPDARRRVEENLSPTPTGVDELVRECHMPPSAVAAVLLELELAGRIERHPGNRVARLDG
jgi:DNA processing protein